MKKLLNNPAMVTLLVLAALASAGWSLFSARATGGSIGAAGNADADDSSVAESDSTRVVANPASGALAQAASSVALRDPFAPRKKPITPLAVTQVVADQIDTVHLSAIWSQDGSTWVVLNGRILKLGEEIGRLRIETATQDGIWVTHWKGRDYLALGSDFTLATPRLAVAAGAPL